MQQDPIVTSAAAPSNLDLPLPLRAEAIVDQVRSEARDARNRAKGLERLAAVLRPLTKPSAYADLAKVSRKFERIEAKLDAFPAIADPARSAVDSIRVALDHHRRRLRESLSRELKLACEEAQLTLRVVQREEPVMLRIPPFGVSIDRDRGRATLQFARLPLATCAAVASEIVAAHREAREQLDGDGFDRQRFLEDCRRAWRAARAALGEAEQERVEIVDFLPYLALQHQSSSFRTEPKRAHYRDYSRAQFAWDVLRTEGSLAHDGWRLNLGVATGTTASKKNRVIWFEDENGEGEFKLTVFFTRTDGAP
ncbi:MAG: hypothetical protein AB7O52_06970 [Planctomycetota bacterium]